MERKKKEVSSSHEKERKGHKEGRGEMKSGQVKEGEKRERGETNE